MGTSTGTGASTGERPESALTLALRSTAAALPLTSLSLLTSATLSPLSTLFQVHGTVFDPINSADLYPAAGASDDWYKSLGMRYAFTTELRDTGHLALSSPSRRSSPVERKCGLPLR